MQFPSLQQKQHRHGSVNGGLTPKMTYALSTIRRRSPGKKRSTSLVLWSVIIRVDSGVVVSSCAVVCAWSNTCVCVCVDRTIIVHGTLEWNKTAVYE